MAWSAPRVWSAGELLTAANMNQFLSKELDYLKGIDIGGDPGIILESTVDLSSLGAVAPLLVSASSLKVANLNADKVDGYEAGLLEKSGIATTFPVSGVAVTVITSVSLDRDGWWLLMGFGESMTITGGGPMTCSLFFNPTPTIGGTTSNVRLTGGASDDFFCANFALYQETSQPQTVELRANGPGLLDSYSGDFKLFAVWLRD